MNNMVDVRVLENILCSLRMASDIHIRSKSVELWVEGRNSPYVTHQTVEWKQDNRWCDDLRFDGVEIGHVFPKDQKEFLSIGNSRFGLVLVENEDQIEISEEIEVRIISAFIPSMVIRELIPEEIPGREVFLNPFLNGRYLVKVFYFDKRLKDYDENRKPVFYPIQKEEE